jgi:hypothetical protein
MKLEFRASTPADAPGIIRLFAAAGLQTELTLDGMHWKYWEPHPDWPGSRSFVISHGADIVAHAAVVPGLFTCAGRRISVVHGVDWAALPHAAAAGVSVMRQVGRMADGLLAIGGSRLTQSMLPHMGFESAGTAISYVLPLRPLHLLGAASGPIWKLPARLGRRILWWSAAPHSTHRQWNARPLGPTETQVIASVLPSTRAADMLSSGRESIVALSRSQPLIRHLLECPIAPMRLFALEEAGAVRGYVLFAFPPGQARIADCWVDSSDVGDWCDAIGCAVALARQSREAAEVVAWASDPILQRALVACGLHARMAEPIQIRLYTSAPAQIPHLRVQMVDDDAAYRHVGRPQLMT